MALQDRLEDCFGRFGRHMRIGRCCSVFHTASAEEVIHLLRVSASQDLPTHQRDEQSCNRRATGLALPPRSYVGDYETRSLSGQYPDRLNLQG